MKDFLTAIFSRGSQNNTFDPLVMIGGVNNSSTSLTTDVFHFDGSGFAQISVMTGGGQAPAATSTFISVSGTTGSVVVQNTNASRRLAVANNDSTAVMYLGYGVAAGTQTYFVRIPSLGYWEMPQPIWQGSLAVIWDTTNTGAGRFTILT